MKSIFNNLVLRGLYISCILLVSCDSKNAPAILSSSPPVEKDTEKIGKLISKSDWKPVIKQMTDDFSFTYGKKTYQGKKKSTGGRPFQSSIKRKDFISYSQSIIEVKKVSDRKYTVEADAELEISYKTTGRRKAEWPIIFTWVKQGTDWKLASVNYTEKRQFKVSKQPETKSNKNAPSRAYATQEAASSISSKSQVGAGNEAQRKVKQSIKSQVRDLSNQNRQ